MESECNLASYKVKAQSADFAARRKAVKFTTVSCLILLAACDDRARRQTPPPQMTPQERAGPRRDETIDKIVRVIVWDFTESNPVPDDAEIWFEGFGSWFFAQDSIFLFGNTVNDLGTRRSQEQAELFLYPDGRNRNEISIPFRFTKETCFDGCERDAIEIEIADVAVTVTAISIDGYSLMLER